jgi:hypothetical protein
MSKLNSKKNAKISSYLYTFVYVDNEPKEINLIELLKSIKPETTVQKTMIEKIIFLIKSGKLNNFTYNINRDIISEELGMSKSMVTKTLGSIIPLLKTAMSIERENNDN